MMPVPRCTPLMVPSLTVLKMTAMTQQPTPIFHPHFCSFVSFFLFNAVGSSSGNRSQTASIQRDACRGNQIIGATLLIAPVIWTIKFQPGDGSINFLPEEGTNGPSAIASVVNGKYEFDRTNGPLVGRYKVMFSPQAKKRAVPPEAKAAAKDKPIKPWNGKADVSPKSLKLDFDIKAGFRSS